MLVVDAGALFEVVTRSRSASAITAAWVDHDLVAPHVIDVEVFGVVRQHVADRRLDATTGHLAVAALRAWPGQRLPHGPLLDRAWELRDNVRGWDAMYVAVAESLDAALQTTDARLARAPGPRCRFELVPPA